MKAELEKQLLEKYPKIFRQKDLPPSQSLICFGLECGDGWYKIIDALCRSIQNYVDGIIDMARIRKDESINPEELQVEAVQVKEKYAGLRFYTAGHDDIVQGMIDMAETLSFMTCEYCGKDGKMRGHGWLFTACDECEEKRMKGDVI